MNKIFKTMISSFLSLVLIFSILLPTSNASEIDSTPLFFEEQIENSEYSVTPFSVSKPFVENPGGGGGGYAFAVALAVGGKTLLHSVKRTIKGGDGNSLDGTGIKNSSMDLVENGLIKQRRYYDNNGKAKQDIDYFHPADGTHAGFPHIHHWDWNASIPRSKNAIEAQF